MKDWGNLQGSLLGLTGSLSRNPQDLCTKALSTDLAGSKELVFVTVCMCKGSAPWLKKRQPTPRLTSDCKLQIELMAQHCLDSLHFLQCHLHERHVKGIHKKLVQESFKGIQRRFLPGSIKGPPYLEMGQLTRMSTAPQQERSDPHKVLRVVRAMPHHNESDPTRARR